jgi:hypothetical protein
VLALADEVIAQELAHGGGYQSVGAATHKAHILLWRGEIAAAQSLVRELLSQARDIDDLQILIPALAAGALVERARSDLRLALHPLQEINRLAHERGGGQFYLGLYVADLVRTCMAADQQTLAVQLIEHAPTQAARHQHARFTAQAVVTETRDDLNKAAQMYEQVAERWAQYGHTFEQGRPCSAQDDANSASIGPKHKRGWRKLVRSSPALALDHSWLRPTPGFSMPQRRTSSGWHPFSFIDDAAGAGVGVT